MKTFTYQNKTALVASKSGCVGQRVTCRAGGPGGFGGGQQPGQPQRLIIPGMEGGGDASRKLVMPSQGRSTGMVGHESPTPLNNFRPPPGFMDAVDKPTVEELGLSTDEMMNRLRSNSGHWHQLAKFLPALQRAGLDSTVVEEMVGLERRMQNVWVAAEQVYESVKRSGEMDDAMLAHFDVEGGESLLYELRLLSIKQRTQAAMYIVTNNLTAQEAQVLARAVKDHERRVGTREGFSSEPGDCLAYRYYRDAQECRREEDAEVCVLKGLAVVVTDVARAKLASMMSEQEQVAAERPTATLTTLRMTKDELGHRVVCVAGTLLDCGAETLTTAPKSSSGGVFSTFTVPPGGYEWVALPNWSILQLAGHPVALSIPNCADVPEVMATSYAKTDEEMKRMHGSGLLLVDLAPESQAVTSQSFYLVADPARGGRLMLREGNALERGSVVLGTVLFLCRPPSRDGGMAGSTAELLSL